MSDPRVWFITGSSSGIGLALTTLLLSLGERVVATLRVPSALNTLTTTYPPTQLLVLPLDVTSPAHLTAAFAQAKAAFGRIDVVVNNAGASVLGEVEGVPVETARKLFDVNFWGAAAVSNEAVRFFRDENPVKGGRLLVVSSVVGRVAVPAMGHYSASKFALEGLTEALAKEVEPEWNIKITLLEPGFVLTPLGSNTPSTPVHPAYTSPTNVAAQLRVHIARQFDPRTAVDVSNVERVARKMHDVAGLESPPLRLPLGEDAVQMIEAQVTEAKESLEKYKAWSEGLEEQ